MDNWSNALQFHNDNSNLSNQMLKTVDTIVGTVFISCNVHN